MEQTFAQLSQQFLEKAERQYGAPFEIQKNVTCCGIEFPMTAGYIKRDGIFSVFRAICRRMACAARPAIFCAGRR